MRLSVVFLVLAGLLCLAALAGVAGADPSGYGYMVFHNVTGSSDGGQFNVPVTFYVFPGSGTDSGAGVYLNGHGLSSYLDVRFTDSAGNLLNYWIQSINGTGATFLVDEPYLPASPGYVTNRIYYGKAGDTGASNIKAAFPLLGEDFNSSLNSSSFTATLNGGSLTFNANGTATLAGVSSSMAKIVSVSTFGTNTRFVMSVETAHAASGFYECFGYGQDTGKIVEFYASGDLTPKYYNYNTGYSGTSTSWSPRAFTLVEMDRGSSSAYWSQNGGSSTGWSTQYPTDALPVSFWASGAPQSLCIDYCYVANWTANAPTHGNYSAEVNLLTTVPSPSFSANVTGGVIPFAVQFSDTSTGFPMWYNWSFGDGSGNSTAQNPSHLYNAVGSYTVIETVSNANGSASASRSISAYYFNYSKTVPVVGSPDGAIWEQKRLIIHAGSGTDGSPGAEDVYLNGHSLNSLLDIGLFNANTSAPVPYMMEKCNTSTAVLWYLALIPASPGSFYLTLDYGESGLSGVQQPYSVWRFYEPFSSGSTPDALNWTTGGAGGSSVSAGKLIVTGSNGWGYAYTRATYGPGTMIVSNTTLTDYVPNGFYGTEYGFRSGGSTPLVSLIITPSLNAVRTYDLGMSSASSNIDPGVTHDYMIKWTSGVVRYYIDNSEMTGSPIISNVPGSALPVAYESMDSSAPCTTDYLMVGNCTTNEPYYGAWSSESNPSVSPVANFSMSPNPVQLGSSVQFSDTSTGGSPTGWAWSFGDGSGNSSVQNPSHVYASTGTYSVILTVSNVYGSSSKKLNLTVASWIPVAGFSYQVQSAIAPYTVQFSDTSTGGLPTGWAWSFGDGTGNSSVQNPSHVYAVAGNYSVILTVSNANGSSSILRYVPAVEGPVYVKQGTVLTGTQAWENSNVFEPTVFYDSNPVIFTNLSHVYKMWYTGGFGDWNTIGIGYAESTDGVSWTKYGRLFTTFARSTVLKVGSVYYMYASYEDTRIDRFTSSDGVHWTDTGTAISRGGSYDSQYLANSYVWIDSDGLWKMLYECSSGSVWTIALAQSPDGVTWAKNASNPVLSRGAGAVGGPDYVQYVNGVYRLWVHGVISGALPSDCYLYTSPNLLSWSQASGNSSQILRTTADEGVGSSIGQTADPDVYNNSGVEYFYYSASTDGNNPSGQLHIKLAVNVTQSFLTGSANFSANVTAGSSPLGVQFTDTSGGAPIGWDWSFGDGSGNSSVQNPVHVYGGGSYTVIETIYYAGGYHSSSARLNYINVAAPSAPVANFSANVTAGFNPLAVQFSDTSSGGAATSWAWSFGDGSANSTVQNPSHVYTVMGNYTAVLTASNGGGSSVKTMLIQVKQYPTAAFSMSLSSGTAQLTDAFSDASTAATSWAWSFGDGSANSSAQSPQHTFNVGGSFVVTLTASNIYGSSSVQHTVTVSPASSGYYVRLRASAPVQYYPLTGILVTVTDPSGAVVNQASTDSNGNTNIYVGPLPAPGTYHVNLHRSDLQDQTLTFDPSGIPPYLIDMPVIMQGSSGANYFYVSGSVTRASDGHPLDLVSVYVYYPNGSLAGSQNTGTAPLSSGQYNIGVLQNPPTGDYTVRVVSQSFENQTKTFSYYGGYTFSVNFQLAYSGSYNVKGYVRDINGQPIISAFVTVSENGLNSGSAVDGTGYYLTAPGFLSPGPVTVRADAPGYDSVSQTITFPGSFDQYGVNWTNFVLQQSPATPTPGAGIPVIQVKINTPGTWRILISSPTNQNFVDDTESTVGADVFSYPLGLSPPSGVYIVSVSWGDYVTQTKQCTYPASFSGSPPAAVVTFDMEHLPVYTTSLYDLRLTVAGTDGSTSDFYYYVTYPGGYSVDGTQYTNFIDGMISGTEVVPLEYSNPAPNGQYTMMISKPGYLPEFISFVKPGDFVSEGDGVSYWNHSFTLQYNGTVTPTPGPGDTITPTPGPGMTGTYVPQTEAERAAERDNAVGLFGLLIVPFFGLFLVFILFDIVNRGSGR